jgi:hypothetical protein
MPPYEKQSGVLEMPVMQGMSAANRTDNNRTRAATLGTLGSCLIGDAERITSFAASTGRKKGPEIPQRWPVMDEVTNQTVPQSSLGLNRDRGTAPRSWPSTPVCPSTAECYRTPGYGPVMTSSPPGRRVPAVRLIAFNARAEEDRASGQERRRERASSQPLRGWC